MGRRHSPVLRKASAGRPAWRVSRSISVRQTTRANWSARFKKPGTPPQRLSLTPPPTHTPPSPFSMPCAPFRCLPSRSTSATSSSVRTSGIALRFTRSHRHDLRIWRAKLPARSFRRHGNFEQRECSCAEPAPQKTPHEDLIRNLASLLDETGLTEIEIEKARCAFAWRGRSSMPAHAAPVLLRPRRRRCGRGAAASSSFENHPGVVTSPMVGTAYRSPEPGAPPFVEIGTAVREGQTLLIIEAMKTMNQIAAPRGGISQAHHCGKRAACRVRRNRS